MAGIHHGERQPGIVLEFKEKGALAARLADEKKADNIVVLNVEGISSFTDAFVICTGSTRLQIRAIANGIIQGLGEAGCGKPAVDGLGSGAWAVLDYGDLVVHLMSPEARDYYQLESLWGDGQEIDWSAPAARAVAWRRA